MNTAATSQKPPRAPAALKWAVALGTVIPAATAAFFLFIIVGLGNAWSTHSPNDPIPIALAAGVFVLAIFAVPGVLLLRGVRGVRPVYLALLTVPAIFVGRAEPSIGIAWTLFFAVLLYAPSVTDFLNAKKAARIKSHEEFADGAELDFRAENAETADPNPDAEEAGAFRAPRAARALAITNVSVAAVMLVVGAAWHFSTRADDAGLAVFKGLADWFSLYLHAALVFILSALALLACARAADGAPYHGDAPRRLVHVGYALLAFTLVRAVVQTVELAVRLAGKESRGADLFHVAYAGGFPERVFHLFCIKLSGILPELSLVVAGFCLMRLPRGLKGPQTSVQGRDLAPAGFFCFGCLFVFGVIRIVANGGGVATLVPFLFFLAMLALPAALCATLAVLSRRARGINPWRISRTAALFPVAVAAVLILVCNAFPAHGNLGWAVSELCLLAWPAWLSIIVSEPASRR